MSLSDHALRADESAAKAKELPKASAPPAPKIESKQDSEQATTPASAGEVCSFVHRD